MNASDGAVVSENEIIEGAELGDDSTYVEKLRDKFFNKHRYILAWGTLFIILASIFKNYGFYYFFYKDPGGVLLYELLRDAGIAFLIASIIAFTIESKASRERNSIMQGFAAKAQGYIKEASEKTLESFFKRELPEGWYEYFRFVIQKSHFIRSNLHLRISFSMLPDNEKKHDPYEEYLYLYQEVSYEVKNVSDNDQILDVEAFIELPADKDLQDLVKMELFCINGMALTGEQIEEARKRKDDTDTHRHYKYSVPVPKGGSVLVRHRSKTPRRKIGSFVWVTKHPSVGVQVDAVPYANFKTKFSVLHEDCMDRVFEEECKDGHISSIKTDKPLMPCQAVEISWQPVNNDLRLLSQNCHKAITEN